MKRNLFFNIQGISEFEQFALEIFQFQAQKNTVYREFLAHLKTDIFAVNSINEIPFLPIQFFKSHQIVASNNAIQQTFLSSGTTGMQQSKHLVTDVAIYEESFRKGFEYFYGNIEDYTVLALLPSYLERDGSSLIYMVNDMIQQSKKPKSGFYLNNLEELAQNLIELDKKGEKVLLIGVSFALLDLVEAHKFQLKNTIVMETGGMKGRRKELIREELHEILCDGFGVTEIHSEYGMTELLSQGYSKGNGIFECPPWMKILTRDTEDALTILPEGKSGGINVIDLANINSCSFIATQDLGKTYSNNTFEVLGRFDNSDIRGCNLLLLK
ncbi:Acyl-protein synthetase, LuxE [Lutibacter agarilyticus]|uniref:Acyl-protein synthetase, LuxE n=1 Tax=Lutibacter agarilyticus TaxID=1109740 RepID=A0A238VZX0_9FLAO|nr:acyl transferase [Lutibacter agarilyticus]SNR39895.1 Acyl-protein synthetase, LuxE [Lutibacter agarilyticus]